MLSSCRIGEQIGLLSLLTFARRKFKRGERVSFCHANYTQKLFAQLIIVRNMQGKNSGWDYYNIIMLLFFRQMNMQVRYF